MVMPRRNLGVYTFHLAYLLARLPPSLTDRNPFSDRTHLIRRVFVS
jgi:hypothetical protein